MRFTFFLKDSRSTPSKPPILYFCSWNGKVLQRISPVVF